MYNVSSIERKNFDVVWIAFNLLLTSWIYLLNYQTVCRKCIFDKITEDELDYCPVCNTNLGCAPLEKLRSASHSPLNLVLYILDTCFMLTTTLHALPK